MLCQFDKLIYPKEADIATVDYMIAIYRPCEIVRDADGDMVSQIKAVGYCLPITDKLRYKLNGHWIKHPRHGLQFEVEGYEEVISHTREGIIGYLASGQIKGVGPKIAEKIYDAFGQDTLDILDHEPEKLMTIRGISEKKLAKIRDSYLASRGARDVIAFLAPHGVTANRAIKIYREYGKDTLDIVRKHPYRLVEMAGIAFKTADKLAMSLGIPPVSPERVDEALMYTMTEAEAQGHMCLEKHDFIRRCIKLLETPEITEDMAAGRAFRLVQDNRLVCYDQYVYRSSSATVENNIAYHITQQMQVEVEPYEHLDLAILGEERKLKFRLAPEQKEAIKMALTSKFCVITGGPGTGKTAVQRALLDLYREKYPTAEIICCAPTGQAAQRMKESSGLPASTIHKALGITARDDGTLTEGGMLTADLILVDEVSMMDTFLADRLFAAIPPHARLVLIGDADQLPSVGPGAVLKEIIKSGVVPVVRLDHVFRQSAGSRIAINARLIKHGNLSMEYGPDFQFFDSNDLTASAEIIENLYLQEVRKYGVDGVAFLTPFRHKTETSVDAMNIRLQALVNPPAPGKPEAVFGQLRFRLGDKVMQVKNYEQVYNGDVGYITSITGEETEATVTVDFGDGRVMEYENDQLKMLDLGYSSTVHKSQGAQYKSVIMNLQCAHAIMLMRAIVYTAITRARLRLLIVGERKALCRAIRNTKADQRGTRLARRIQDFIM